MPEWGHKRICPGCGAKFYDKGAERCHCPACGKPYDAARATVLKSERLHTERHNPAGTKENDTASAELAEGHVSEKPGDKPGDKPVGADNSGAHAESTETAVKADTGESPRPKAEDKKDGEKDGEKDKG